MTVNEALAYVRNGGGLGADNCCPDNTAKAASILAAGVELLRRELSGMGDCRKSLRELAMYSGASYVDSAAETAMYIVWAINRQIEGLQKQVEAAEMKNGRRSLRDLAKFCGCFDPALTHLANEEEWHAQNIKEAFNVCTRRIRGLEKQAGAASAAGYLEAMISNRDGQIEELQKQVTLLGACITEGVDKFTSDLCLWDWVHRMRRQQCGLQPLKECEERQPIVVDQAAKIAELEATRDRLPKTKDGKVVLWGDYVWSPNGQRRLIREIGPAGIVLLDNERGSCFWRMASEHFSTAARGD